MLNLHVRITGQIENPLNTFAFRNILLPCERKLAHWRISGWKIVNPCCGSLDCGLCIHETRSIIVVEVQAVCVGIPFRIVRIIFCGGPNQNILHIPPTQIGIGLQH